MTDDVGAKPDESIPDQAVAWLVRVQSDTVTDADFAALAGWLSQSEAHRAAFEEIESLDADIQDRSRAIADALRFESAAIVPLRARPTLKRRERLLAALAASIVAVIGVGWIADHALRGAAATYQTARGQIRSVALADGTRLQLDAATRLTVRLGWRSRRVEMAAGEAAFDVAKDPGRPFVIAVGDQTVRVVGTAFNIRHYDGALVITVKRGVVELRQPGLGGQVLARLTPGDQWRHLDGSMDSRLTKVDPDAAFSWLQNRLVCDDQPLTEIVAYLNRRYSRPIRLASGAASRRFTGVLDIGANEDAVAARLASYLSLSVDHRADSITLR